MEMTRIITMRHACAASLALMAAGACAQELNESMTVQGAYDPVIRHHERLSALPSRIELPLPEASLPLAERGVEVPVYSSFAPMGDTGWHTTLPAPSRGYLDIQAGSFLNTSVSAGYKAIYNDKSSLGLWLQHCSSSLFRANETSPYRRRYDETLGATFSHTFTPGTLSLKATWHLGYFNYYRALGTQVSGTDSNYPLTYMPGSQTLNDFAAAAAWRGARRSTGFYYSASIDYRFFGYRRLYEWADNAYVSSRAPHENDIKANVSLGYAIDAQSTFSLGIRGRVISYSRSSLSTPGFYTFTPGYTFKSDNLRLRASARLDLTSRITGPVDFSTFHAAPDIALDFTSSRFTLSLSASGGVEPNTMASARELCYYAVPAKAITTPAYTPIDARLRLGFGNFNGFSAVLFGSYAISRNTPLEGIYPLYLYGQLETPTSYLLHPALLSVHGFSMGADLHFALGDILSVEGTLTYSPQNGSTGSFNGIDRPRWILSTEANVRPIAPLLITAGYDYRGVRHLYYRAEPGSNLASLRLPDLYDLHCSATYTLASRYTLGISVSNILSSNPWICREMPQEGITVTGRFAVNF